MRNAKIHDNKWCSWFLWKIFPVFKTTGETSNSFQIFFKDDKQTKTRKPDSCLTVKTDCYRQVVVTGKIHQIKQQYMYKRWHWGKYAKKTKRIFIACLSIHVQNVAGLLTIYTHFSSYCNEKNHTNALPKIWQNDNKRHGKAVD